MAKLGFRHLPLLDSLAAAARKRIGEFVAQDSANTVWAFAVFAVRHDPLLSSISA